MAIALGTETETGTSSSDDFDEHDPDEADEPDGVVMVVWGPNNIGIISILAEGAVSVHAVDIHVEVGVLRWFESRRFSEERLVKRGILRSDCCQASWEHGQLWKDTIRLVFGSRTDSPLLPGPCRPNTTPPRVKVIGWRDKPREFGVGPRY